MIQTNLTLENPATESTECIKIEPIPEGVHRPIWSVMIPTYNRTRYLEQTLTSVLEQDIGSEQMQIEVIDNCSTEVDVEAVVRRLGKQRISLYKQPKNVGLSANLNTCIRHARGHLIHILHDDDLVLPGFYRHLQSAFEKEPSIGAAFCRYARVEEKTCQKYLAKLERGTPGIITNWLERIAVKQLIEPPAIVVRRSVYENLGGFHPELGFAVDWEMWKRIAAIYPFWYEPKVLAYYRIHSLSSSFSAITSGQNILDTRRAIEVSRSYLPEKIVDKLSNQAKENYVIFSLKLALKALNKGDIYTATVQIREGIKCKISLKIMGLLALLPLLAVLSSFKKTVRKWSPLEGDGGMG